MPRGRSASLEEACNIPEEYVIPDPDGEVRCPEMNRALMERFLEIRENACFDLAALTTPEQCPDKGEDPEIGVRDYKKGSAVDHMIYSLMCKL